MSANVKCPNCGNEFEPTDAVREEVEKELRAKMLEWQKSKEETLRKSIVVDFENKFKLLEQNNFSNEEKLKEARRKELEFLQKEQELKNREAELEIDTQRKLQAEREKLSEDLRKIEEQKTAAKETEYQLRIKELEKQRDDQKKLAEEMRRKAEQGSSQLQGEVQELALEEILKANFPFDLISEVGKGVRGADCVQIIRNNFGQECGKIIYESKRTSAFGNDWIEKLKGDMRSLGADIAVIVTRVMPRDMESFGAKEGVWICTFSEVKALSAVLRDGVIRVFNSLKSHENKGDKMSMLYNYLSSNEFHEQWKAMREGFLSLRTSIQRERDAMEKLWKMREKQLDKVLLNSAQITCSIQGIQGMDAIDLNLLEPGETNEDDIAH
jgi:hypothetical protein